MCEAHAFCFSRIYVRQLTSKFGGANGMDSQLSSSSSGTTTNDPLNLPDNWMKNIILRAASFTKYIRVFFPTGQPTVVQINSL
ncbi:hypothetical protein [Paraglaciecola sp.]|uniref:hypothetical protein n=1 Tax=Paraglaciecola sp. TaxID=1920173 RepID=UPI003F4A9BDD